MGHRASDNADLASEKQILSELEFVCRIEGMAIGTLVWKIADRKPPHTLLYDAMCVFITEYYKFLQQKRHLNA
jgi:hypothetical protein